MSETPPAPDGSDPRVLTIPDDDPTVYIARGNSAAKKYHTRECAVVEQMTEPKLVPKTQAEWNDHDKCDRCKRRDSEGDYERPGAGPIRIKTGYHTVSPLRCLTLRALALGGMNHADAAAEVGVSKTTATRHIGGKCTCDHNGRTVTYTDDNAPHAHGDGTPDNLRGSGSYIPPTTCARLRRLLADAPIAVKHVAALFDVSATAIRKHAKATERCQHSHDETHPPLEYDRTQQTWVRVHE